MMQYRKVKAWLVSYLSGQAADYGYRVVGYNDSDIDVSQLRKEKRLIQVYAKGGDFPKGSGAFTGPSVHDVSLSIELLTACSASIDLTVLNNSEATADEIADAIAASTKAAALADENFDDLFETIYQLLMANDQQDLGHEREVGGRWVTGWKKGTPLNRGENVIIPGSIDFTFRVAENFTGVVPKAPVAGTAVRVAINASADEGGTPQEGSAVLSGG